MSEVNEVSEVSVRLSECICVCERERERDRARGTERGREREHHGERVMWLTVGEVVPPVAQSVAERGAVTYGQSVAGLRSREGCTERERRSAGRAG